jgi:hypothetical protein
MDVPGNLCPRIASSIAGTRGYPFVVKTKTNVGKYGGKEKASLDAPDDNHKENKRGKRRTAFYI